MSYKNVVLFDDIVAWSMLRGPQFSPEDGRDQAYVFNELRTRLSNMQKEWWGGEELYQQMSGYIDKAENYLNTAQPNEAIRAFGEIYAIIDQTLRPKKTPKAT